MKRFLILLCALALSGGPAISAARAAQASAPTLPAHPGSAYLPAVGYVHQSWNNCGPASIISVLNYYGYGADQAEAARRLRPNGGYMVAGVIDAYVEDYGLRAQRFRNGQLEHVQALVAAGIPVIVLQWLDRVGGVPHFRVVRGYDDRTRQFLLSDPIYGPNVTVSYDDFRQLWGVYGQEFIPVFRPAQARLVGRLLGVNL